MILLLAIALGSAFVALVLASQLPHPSWVWAVKGLALAVAVALMSAGTLVADALPRVQSLRPWWWPATCLVVALFLRPSLVGILTPPQGVPRLDYWQLQEANLAVVAALFGLGGAIHSVQSHGSWYHLAGAGSMMALAFFVIGPVCERGGIPVDHRTFLALVGLGLGAFAVTEGWRRFAGK